MRLYGLSSTILGSIISIFTSSGVRVIRIDRISVFRHTLLPVPVRPAISRCGILVRSTISGRPLTSLPRKIGIRMLSMSLPAGFDQLRSRTITCLSFGTSTPTVFLPGIGATTRTAGTRSAIARSSAAPITFESRRPGFQFQLELRDDRTGVDLGDLHVQAEFLERLFQRRGSQLGLLGQQFVRKLFRVFENVDRGEIDIPEDLGFRFAEQSEDGIDLGADGERRVDLELSRLGNSVRDTHVRRNGGRRIGLIRFVEFRVNRGSVVAFVGGTHLSQPIQRPEQNDKRHRQRPIHELQEERFRGQHQPDAEKRRDDHDGPGCRKVLRQQHPTPGAQKAAAADHRRRGQSRSEDLHEQAQGNQHRDHSQESEQRVANRIAREQSQINQRQTRQQKPVAPVRRH